MWRRRRGCHVFIAKRGPKTEEKPQVALSGIISYLTAKCGGNVHDTGVVEVIASSFFGSFYTRNAAEFGGDSEFWSNDQPGQWICLDFKTIRIEPTHYTIQRLGSFDIANHQLKALCVLGVKSL
jgi:hypothetical protein